MKPISSESKYAKPHPTIMRPASSGKVARAQTSNVKSLVASPMRNGVQRAPTTCVQRPMQVEPSLDALCDELTTLVSTPLTASEDLSPASRLTTMKIIRQPVSQSQKKHLIDALAAKNEQYVTLTRTRFDALDAATKAFERVLTQAQRPAKTPFAPVKALRSMFHKPRTATPGAHLRFDQNKTELSAAAWKVADQLDNLIVMLDGLGISTSDLKEIQQAMKGNMSSLGFSR